MRHHPAPVLTKPGLPSRVPVVVRLQWDQPAAAPTRTHKPPSGTPLSFPTGLLSLPMPTPSLPMRKWDHVARKSAILPRSMSLQCEVRGGWRRAGVRGPRPEARGSSRWGRRHCRAPTFQLKAIRKPMGALSTPAPTPRRWWGSWRWRCPREPGIPSPAGRPFGEQGGRGSPGTCALGSETGVGGGGSAATPGPG